MYECHDRDVAVRVRVARERAMSEAADRLIGKAGVSTTGGVWNQLEALFQDSERDTGDDESSAMLSLAAATEEEPTLL